MAGILDFSGKTALVTGAASGIGAATARLLAAQGIAELVLIDRDRPALDRLWKDQPSPTCKLRPYGGDVADPSLWSLMSRELPRIDHAVINAGIPGAGKSIVDTDITDWRKTMAVNLDGTFLALRSAMRNMSRTSEAKPAGGSIVLTASVAGLRGVGPIDYGASKAAVAQMARIAGREGGPLGIRVNAIAPGGVDTPMWDHTEAFRELVASSGSREAAIAAMGQPGSALGRFATAEEIAGQIAFLLSDLATTITGTVLVSDGGFSI
ncbi:SDR family NAD(P)-dependent oxidoreductase [Novosphingobium lentum]|uniref:SDR family NAD(P)-dependent oxidoreductase n=1 Tax=Novosphingobium lentum TaxID=145287 RepID=UPI00082CC5DF|nr:SDR family oxidoreductase [Novosphingobium lentum]